MAFRCVACSLLVALCAASLHRTHSVETQPASHLHAAQESSVETAAWDVGNPFLAFTLYVKQWGEAQAMLFVGNQEVPLLVSLLERYERQYPAQSPHEPLEGEPVSPVMQVKAILGQVFIITCFAYLYICFRKVPQGEYAKAHPHDYDDDWRHHCLSFLCEPGTACCALCCLPVRWAETISLMKGSLSFWAAFFLFALLFFFRSFTPLAAIIQLLFIIVGVSYRQEMRRKFHFESQGGCSVVTDILMYTFCACCAVVQEARHMEEALAHGHPETEGPEGRQRSVFRSSCLTSNFVYADHAHFSDGPKYDENSKLHDKKVVEEA